MKWARSERGMLGLLRVFYPSLIPKFMLWRRKKHCSKFIMLLSKNIELIPFWKNEEDRMRNYMLTKFSFSHNLSLGYIDFLDTRLTTDSYEGP